MVKKRKTKPTEKLDVSNHILVPKHEKCSETEKKSVLKTYGVEIKDLPKISINDAAIVDMELSPGDLVKVTRNSQTAGKTIFYRVVIEIK
ncbi:MAG TPA: DNA-directed RNA polymerase subunit H [Alphaproteobacteria bacterium]|nr:DNA-directed RNA polymerase subunit H [Alphaproteobacteria bacterium]